MPLKLFVPIGLGSGRVSIVEQFLSSDADWRLETENINLGLCSFAAFLLRKGSKRTAIVIGSRDL